MATKLPLSFGAIADFCGDVPGKYDFRNVFLVWSEGTLSIAAAGPNGGIRVSVPCDQADWGEFAVGGYDWKRAFSDANKDGLLEVRACYPTIGCQDRLHLFGSGRKGEWSTHLDGKDGRPLSLDELLAKPSASSPKISVVGERLAKASKVLAAIAPGVLVLEVIESGNLIMTASLPELKAEAILMKRS